MKDFSDDLLTRIFSVLGPADLLSVETVAARWRLCAVDELWRNSTIELWKNVIFNVPSEFGILQRVKRIPLALLKRLVARVDSSHCLEKNDYQKLLVCCLLFRFRERPHIRINGMTTRPKLPDWYQKIDNLKASYFFSARDIRRTTILASELCTISWVFHFKHNQDDEEGFVTKFNEDFTMISQMHSQKMNWQFLDLRELCGGRSIQVEQYPPLTCHRRPDGSWMMENMFVWFEQVQSMGPQDVPIV